MLKHFPAPGARVRLRTPLTRLACAIALCAAPPLPAAHANNYGESASWQFASPQDLAAQAAARDVIERRRGGVFAAPIYNTHIARQYNCSISASAIGNNGAQSAVANSPTTTGATSSASGNNSSSSVTGDGTDATIGNGQSNSGAVGSRRRVRSACLLFAVFPPAARRS